MGSKGNRGGRGSSRSRISGLDLGLGVSLLLASQISVAAPVPCPLDSGVSSCELTVGEATLSVDATSLGGGSAVARLEFAGVTQLAGQASTLFSFDENEFIDAQLLSATADAVSRQIQVRFREAFASAVDITGTFTLSQSGDTAVVDESIEVVAGPGLPTGFTAAGRIYTITDFDLDGTAIDTSIAATTGGTVFTQIDGGTTATLEVLGAPPSAHQVAACCSLASVLSDVPLTLDGTNAVSGPDDFQLGVSWDRSVSSATPFTATLRKTIQVPEPATGSGAAVAFLVLAALAARTQAAKA